MRPEGHPFRKQAGGSASASAGQVEPGVQGGRVEGAGPVPKMGRCPLSTPSEDVLRLNRRKSHHLIDLDADRLRHVLRLYTREAREGQ